MPDNLPADPTPPIDLNAMLTGLVNMAAGVASYLNALVNEGLTRQEALILTITWQQTLIQTTWTTPQPPTPETT